MIHLGTIFWFLLLRQVSQINSVSNDTFQKMVSIEGPISVEHAVNCLQETTWQLLQSNLFVTVVNNDITEDPANEIMIRYLRKFNLDKTGNVSYAYEINNGSRTEFKSFQVCTNCENKEEGTKKIYKNHFKRIRKSSHYLMFADNVELIEENLLKLENLVSYNNSARWVIFYANLHEDYLNKTYEILSLAFSLNKVYTKVLIPISYDSFALFTYDLFSQRDDFCGSNPQLDLLNTCHQGVYNRSTFYGDVMHKTFNCTIKAYIMRVPPFVISLTQGLEILILEEIKNRLNLKFDVAYSGREEDWGIRVNGTWGGLLAKMYVESFTIGTGCISLREDRLQDFTYSTSYLLEKLVWVVPSAERIPQWKLILVIFEASTWAAVIVSFLVIGVGLYLTSRWNAKEYNFMKSFGSTMLIAYCILVSNVVWRQPRTLINRIWFLTWTLGMIIISCMYQSGLYDMLTLPRYEHQINSYEDVLASGLGIGGISIYKDVFYDKERPRSMNIYRSYEIYDVSNDTMFIWLLTVAKDRDTITVLGEMYTRYYLGQKMPVLANADGSDKAFVVSEQVMSDPISMIYSKEFLLAEAFDRVINGLIHAGLIELWKNNFLSKGAVDKDDIKGADSEVENEITEEIVIKLSHLEGAFFVLGLGTGLGIISFLLEIGITAYVQRRRRERIRRRAAAIEFMQRGFRAAYHEALLKEKW